MVYIIHTHNVWGCKEQTTEIKFVVLLLTTNSYKVKTEIYMKNQNFKFAASNIDFSINLQPKSY